jgi:hypothetical protein
VLINLVHSLQALQPPPSVTIKPPLKALTLNQKADAFTPLVNIAVQEMRQLKGEVSSLVKSLRSSPISSHSGFRLEVPSLLGSAAPTGVNRAW